jgi:predicted XRE-type DNA-binding protein
MHDLSLQDQTTEFLLYTTPNGEVKVEVLLSNETLWLTQERMADLFGVQRPAITKHLKNIFESNELQKDVVCSILEHTTEHGAIAGKTQNWRSSISRGKPSLMEWMRVSNLSRMATISFCFSNDLL